MLLKANAAVSTQNGPLTTSQESSPYLQPTQEVSSVATNFDPGRQPWTLTPVNKAEQLQDVVPFTARVRPVLPAPAHFVQTYLSPSPYSSQQAGESPLPTQNHNNSDPMQVPVENVYLQQEHTPELSDCPETTDCYCPPITSSAPISIMDPSSETSCEAAANIIAGMRGHGNIEQARAELGCGEDRECSVKNIVLFQVMDRS
jgi:hypothetical protein